MTFACNKIICDLILYFCNNVRMRTQAYEISAISLCSQKFCESTNPSLNKATKRSDAKSYSFSKSVSSVHFSFFGASYEFCMWRSMLPLVCFSILLLHVSANDRNMGNFAHFVGKSFLLKSLSEHKQSFETTAQDISIAAVFGNSFFFFKKQHKWFEKANELGIFSSQQRAMH